LDVEKAIQSEYPTFYVRVEDSDGAVRLETPKIRPMTGRDALLPYMTAEPRSSLYQAEEERKGSGVEARMQTVPSRLLLPILHI
jgi:NurA-like 5'-3' nuclease